MEDAAAHAQAAYDASRDAPASASAYADAARRAAAAAQAAEAFDAAQAASTAAVATVRQLAAENDRFLLETVAAFDDLNATRRFVQASIITKLTADNERW